MNNRFVEMKAVAKSFNNGTVKTEVLHSIDLELGQGEFGLLLGPSGSGKSTVMNIVGGMERADQGVVRVAGIELTQLTDPQLTEYRRKEIGVIFQQYQLIPNLTVMENIEVAQQISEQPLSMEELLAAVSLESRKNAFPYQLSGGEQQRVAIARAVAKRPSLLLCDEPTGALDYATSKEILKLIENLNRSYGTTVLIISHNIALSKLAHRTFRLRDGIITVTEGNESPISAEELSW